MSDNQYRCYFTDGDDRIKAVEVIACEDDAGALLKVEQLLAASSYQTAELWQRTRLIGKWSNSDRSVTGPSEDAGPASIMPSLASSLAVGK